MKLGSRDELKRPNACVLIILMLIPVLALVTIAVPAAAATCSCPYGGQYYSSIYTKLCGWQYNVCVSFDYNCANDYPAVCGATTTRTTSTWSTTTRSTTTIRTGTSCGYIEMMMGQCQQAYTLTNVMITARRLQLYTVILILKSQPPAGAGWVAGWKVYVDGNHLGLTDSQGTLKMTLTGGSHDLELEMSLGALGSPYVRVTSQFYVNSDGQLVTVTLP